MFRDKAKSNSHKITKRSSMNTQEHISQLYSTFECIDSCKFQFNNVNTNWCFEVELTLLSGAYKRFLGVKIFHKDEIKIFITTADTFTKYLIRFSTFERVYKINEWNKNAVQTGVLCLLYSILCQEQRNNHIWKRLLTFDNRDNTQQLQYKQIIDKNTFANEIKIFTFYGKYKIQFKPKSLHNKTRYLSSTFSFLRGINNSICHSICENDNKMDCQLRCCYKEYELANVVLKRMQKQHQNIFEEISTYTDVTVNNVFDSEDNKSDIILPDILRVDESKSELQPRGNVMNIGVYRYVSNDEDNFLIDDGNSSSDDDDYLEEQMRMGLHRLYPNVTYEIPNNIEYEPTVNEDDDDDSFQSFGSGINQDELSDSDEENFQLYDEMTRLR